MGLGNFFVRPATAPVQNDRVIAGFAFGRGVVDGGYADGFGEFGFGSYRGAMTIPGVWRAATLLADLIGGLPWHAYRDRAGNPVQRLDPTPALLAQPNPPDTRMSTFSAWTLDLLMHGNAIGVYTAFGADGWPTAVVPVSAERVEVRRVDEHTDSPLPIGSIEYRIGDRHYGPAEVLHVKGHHEPGHLRGRGVLEEHLDTVWLAREQGRQARALSRHGVPTGLLKSDNADLTEDEARDMKARWLQAQDGRSVAVLNSSTTFQPLSWNPEELQLVQARTFSLKEIGLIFGIPGYFLGVEAGSLTYSNAETQALDLLKFTISPHLARFEQALAQALPRGTYVKANTDAILRADTMTRYSAYGLALQHRFLTVDEVRELEDRPPLTPEQAPAPPEPVPADGQARARRDADQLHHYWVFGEGREKWVHHLHPWTTLYHHLLKYLPSGEAKRTAAQWFHDALGYWPGDEAGDNPVGPG